jgi:uncharacterized RmlC-like cupin family protein
MPQRLRAIARRCELEKQRRAAQSRCRREFSCETGQALSRYAKTGPHHHGELETVIYIVRGRARFRWGERLEFVDEAGPGDFVYVPPYVPHQELNAKKDAPVEAVIVRSGQEPVVVNLEIPSPEEDPTTPQPDPFHSAPGKF